MTDHVYTGSRYVPLIDGEWDNSKEYEPLTVVLSDGDSYTSRQWVPTGVDISNSTYWAKTGDYNGQFAELENVVNGFDERVETLDLKTAGFVTPEMFGAVGDGVTDDTEAFDKALAASSKIYCKQTYFLTDGLKISSRNGITIFGKFTIKSNSNGIHIDGCNNFRLQNCSIYAKNNGIYITSDSKYSTYLYFENIYAECTKTNENTSAFKVECTNSFINEITCINCWYGNNFYYGINLNNSTSYEMNDYKFISCSTELCKGIGQYIKNGMRILFLGCRHGETYSLIFKTEEKVYGLMIIGGSEGLHSTTPLQLSNTTNGFILGNTRFAVGGYYSPYPFVFIIDGKPIIQTRGVLNNDFINTASKLSLPQNNFTYNYVQQNSENATITLDTNYYFGVGKINEFYIKRADWITAAATIVYGENSIVVPADDTTKIFKIEWTPAGCLITKG